MGATTRNPASPAWPSFGEEQYRSASYQRVIAQLERFARDPQAPVLLEGESGTGKTSLARRLHELSPRRKAPMRHVVLSTLDDALASSELFGHVIGAFTDARASRTGQFASANGGTLFLDEIGKASRAIQQKLLHAIEYGEIRPVGSDRELRTDVRIVAATNVALSELVERGEFLADLNARLETFRIRLPPLRERRADIPELVQRSLERHARASGYDRLPEVDAELMVALQRAPWPNNIRQLDATIHRLLVDADGSDVLGLAHCDEDLAFLRLCASRNAVELDREQIELAIERTGSISAAARQLGVDRKTLRRRRGIADERRENLA